LTSTAPNKSGGVPSIVNRYWYSAWGEILPQSVEGVPQPFKFAGAEYDASTGLYKMGARYYDPAIGQFTQLDALGGGYRYALNNPVKFKDRTGYEPVQIPGVETIYIVEKAPREDYSDAPDINFAEITGLGWMDSLLGYASSPGSWWAGGGPHISAGGDTAEFVEQIAERASFIHDIYELVEAVTKLDVDPWGLPPIPTSLLTGQSEY
jgi:RHS repeat-associated protein